MKQLLLLAALLSPGCLYAQSCTTATCTAADLTQSAVLAAWPATSNANSTVTVNWPSGTIAWTSGLSLSIPSAVTTLILQGQTTVTCTGTAGTSGYSCTATDATIIQNNQSGNGATLAITANSAGTLRVTGITLSAGTQTATYSGNFNVFCQDVPGQLRVDHVHFSNTSVLARFYDCFGVMDHSVLENSSEYNNDVTVYDSGYGGGVNGDGGWAQPTGFGSANFLYFEDNEFEGGAADDCTDGGRAVFRYNTLVSQSAFQTHPTGGGGPDERGCRALEVYKNYASGSNSSPQFNFDFVSSGPQLIWGNTASTGYQNFITIHSMRRDNSTYSESPTPTSWGYCGTSFNGTGSAWDGNSSTTTGYPCIDQPGQGEGQLITGYMPSAVNSVTGTIAWTHEYLEPVYEWLNAWTTSGGGSYLSNYESDVLVQNRDFYLYTGSFSGTSGVGSGVLVSRPSTCTAGPGGTFGSSPTGSYGVAYWATDANSGNGELYVCTATNTWTAVYQPYTYPHPLDGGGGPPLVATPSISPVAGAYASPQTIAITDATAGATICYTTNGSTPTATTPGICDSGSTTYTGSFSLTIPSTGATVSAIGTLSAATNSGVATKTYALSGGTAATPSFSPAGGIYSSAQTVSISTASAGAVICWNITGSPATNGSTGCATGTLYSGSPLTVSANETIYAVAGGAGYADSSVASASYVIIPTCANTALGGGWTCVSDAAAWTGSSVTSLAAGAFPANPSTGSLIVVFQFNGGSAACSAPTDTLGNSAVAISSGTFSGGTMCDYYLVVAAGGADTVTCNAGGAATELGCGAVNVTGDASSSQLDQTCTASGGTTGSGADNMACSVPITPGGSNELVLAWSVTSVATGVSAGTDFTMIDAVNQNGEYYRQSTSAAITPAQTAATSGVGYGFVAAAFKPPGTMMAGPAPPTSLTARVQ